MMCLNDRITKSELRIDRTSFHHWHLLPNRYEKRMTPNEKFTDELIHQLVRTAVDLNRETTYVKGIAEIASETEILGSILAGYFKKSGRKIAETAYAALDEAGLALEALAFAELWRRSNPEQNDLWATEDDDLN